MYVKDVLHITSRRERGPLRGGRFIFICFCSLQGSADTGRGADGATRCLSRTTCASPCYREDSGNPRYLTKKRVEEGVDLRSRACGRPRRLLRHLNGLKRTTFLETNFRVWPPCVHCVLDADAADGVAQGMACGVARPELPGACGHTAYIISRLVTG